MGFGLVFKGPDIPLCGSGFGLTISRPSSEAMTMAIFRSFEGESLALEFSVDLMLKVLRAVALGFLESVFLRLVGWLPSLGVTWEGCIVTSEEEITLLQRRWLDEG